MCVFTCPCQTLKQWLEWLFLSVFWSSRPSSYPLYLKKHTNDWDYQLGDLVGVSCWLNIFCERSEQSLTKGERPGQINTNWWPKMSIRESLEWHVSQQVSTLYPQNLGFRWGLIAFTIIWAKIGLFILIFTIILAYKNWAANTWYKSLEHCVDIASTNMHVKTSDIVQYVTTYGICTAATQLGWRSEPPAKCGYIIVHSAPRAV